MTPSKSQSKFTQHTPFQTANIPAVMTKKSHVRLSKVASVCCANAINHGSSSQHSNCCTDPGLYCSKYPLSRPEELLLKEIDKGLKASTGNLLAIMFSAPLISLGRVPEFTHFTPYYLIRGCRDITLHTHAHTHMHADIMHAQTHMCAHVHVYTRTHIQAHAHSG